MSAATASNPLIGSISAPASPKSWANSSQRAPATAIGVAAEDGQVRFVQHRKHRGPVGGQRGAILGLDDLRDRIDVQVSGAMPGRHRDARPAARQVQRTRDGATTHARRPRTAAGRGPAGRSATAVIRWSEVWRANNVRSSTKIRCLPIRLTKSPTNQMVTSAPPTREPGVTLIPAESNCWVSIWTTGGYIRCSWATMDGCTRNPGLGYGPTRRKTREVPGDICLQPAFGRGVRPCPTRSANLGTLVARTRQARHPASSLWTPAHGSAEPLRWCWKIGCGSGTSTLAMARGEPDIDVIAVEIYRRGLAQLLCAIDNAQVSNIRLIRGNGFDVLGPDRPEFVDRCPGVFPDPWPKARHHKRRFLRPGTVALIADRLPPVVCCTPRPTMPATQSTSLKLARTWNKAHPGWSASIPAPSRSRSPSHVPLPSTRRRPKKRAAPYTSSYGSGLDMTPTRNQIRT